MKQFRLRKSSIDELRQTIAFFVFVQNLGHANKYIYLL